MTTYLGDHSDRVTPVPIPNTEVKPVSADGTWGEIPWESRTSPDYSKNAPPGCCRWCVFYVFTYTEDEVALAALPAVHDHKISHCTVEGDYRPGTSGVTVSNTESRVVDPVTGEDQGVGDRGELCKELIKFTGFQVAPDKLEAVLLNSRAENLRQMGGHPAD